MKKYTLRGKDEKTMTEEKTKDMTKHESEPRTNEYAPPVRWLDGIRALWESILMLGAGFFFGGTALPLSVYPLGCALISALPRHGLSVLIGIWLRCAYATSLGETLLPYSIGASAILACRLLLCLIVYGGKRLLHRKRLSDTVMIRVLVCVTTVLIISLSDILQNGITLEKTLAMLLSGAASMAFSFLYTFFFEEEHRGTPAYEAGLGAVAFSAALSFLPFSIGNFSLAEALAFAVTLYVGFLGSPTRSSAVGLLCGLALGGYYAPVLALAGLVAGIFSEVHALLSGMATVLVSVCGILYFGGAEGVVETLPELLFAAFAVTGLICIGLLGTTDAEKRERGDADSIKALLARRNEAERERRMTEISQAMNSLSEIIRGLSERARRPEPRKLSEKCRTVWIEHCQACPNRDSCEGDRLAGSIHTAEIISARLLSEGKISRERLFELTGHRCPSLSVLAEKLNLLAAQMQEDAIREDKTRVFAADYESMAQMFADAAAENETHLTVDALLTEKLGEALSGAGLYTESAAVCGDRKKCVILSGKEIMKPSFSPAVLRSICEDVCGVPFGAPSFSSEKGNGTLTLESIPRYTAEIVSRQKQKKGETVCGDSFCSMKNGDGYEYAILCDGMGSGEDAALTSRLCGIFLEKMLSCGNKKATSLEMLNHFLTSRAVECFATVDLVEIDLMLGVASFLKSGAVPSYIIRDRRLYKITSGTFPIGILPEVSVEVTEFELCDGDVILLCSDGVSSDIEVQEGIDPNWFTDFISREWTSDLHTMAERILSAADSLSEKSDDMTVGLIRLKKS